MFHALIIAEDTIITILEHPDKDTAPLVLKSCDRLTGKESEPTLITFSEAAAVLHGLMDGDSQLPFEAAAEAVSRTGASIQTLATQQREAVEKLLKDFPPECRPIA